MATLEDIARAALDRQDLLARELVQELQRAGEDIAIAPEPVSREFRVRTMAAAVASLFAWRSGTQAPAWTKNAGRFPEGFYTSKFAAPGSATRSNLELQTPDVLRAFGVFASPDYLRLV